MHAAVARSTFPCQHVKKGALLEVHPSQNHKNTPIWEHICTFKRSFPWKAQWNLHLFKLELNVWVLWHLQPDRAGVGRLKRICKASNISIRDVRRSGRCFPERGCILEHQIVGFAEMILRDRCSTSYDLASLFRGRRNILHKWSGKITKRIGTRPSALHSTFHV